nr:D-hexose-6-phosphate mutarotase [Thiocystis violacea]
MNAEFGLAGTLRFVAGRGGLPLMEIENPLATATITPHGGQVLSYRPADAAEDLLFVSERALFASGEEIKGGIPICWPWFGRDPEDRGRRIHGFARTFPWSVLACAARPDGSTWVKLGLADDADTRDIWPHYFNLWVEISVGATLSVELTTRNAGDGPFRITQGLHAYFKIGDPTRLAVSGLDGCRYIDKAAGAGDALVLQDGPVRVAAEVNRIYEAVPSSLAIEDPVLGRRIRIDSRHSRTCVVWNPWVESARAMPDLDDLDYQRFLCVETVNTASEVIDLPPGGESRLAADYRIEPL